VVALNFPVGLCGAVIVTPALVKVVNPDGELKVKLSNVADVAPSGNPPTVKATVVCVPLHIAALAANGLNPLLLAVTLALGLKIPIEYRITATMTMIKIAQP
jgi:hypothetical protein